jgi:hypothetical protein
VPRDLDVSDLDVSDLDVSDPDKAAPAKPAGHPASFDTAVGNSGLQQ